MKVIHPEDVQFSWIVLISLAASIGVKLWMCGFNRKLGRRIDSSVMLATAQDSLNDVIATSATVVSVGDYPCFSRPRQAKNGVRGYNIFQVFA